MLKVKSEWGFHHLYFAFDAIDIYVNRTDDNSINILHEILSLHPNVMYNDQHLDEQFDKLKPHFIMYGMNKYEQKYLTLLYKGNPEQQGIIKIKS